MEEKSLPLVSVVVPCYNHEKYVKETIESIINQTYKNIELIVIDDGSKDNSIQVIQELADKYVFTFIHRPNKGLSATLNDGIRLSKGKYFCACASDDIYILNKIEKQVEFMEANPDYGMCYGKIIEFDKTGYKKEREIKNAKSGWIFDDLILQNFIPAVTQMTKKRILIDVGLFDEELYIEDWDMWLIISEKFQIGFLDEYLAYYRNHNTNISSNALKMYEAKQIIIYKWRIKNNYSLALKIINMKYFRDISRLHKRKSIVFIFKCFINNQYIFNLDFFIALFNLLKWK
jgi:alpha-1,3-rhamnosyltransferase